MKIAGDRIDKYRFAAIYREISGFVTKEFSQLYKIGNEKEYIERARIEVCKVCPGPNLSIIFRFEFEGETYGIELFLDNPFGHDDENDKKDVFKVRKRKMGFIKKAVYPEFSLDEKLPTLELNYVYPSWIENGVEELRAARVVDA